MYHLCASQVVTSCYWMRLAGSGSLVNICRAGFAKLETPSHAPEGEETRSYTMWHLQPIRGRWQADLTNQRPAGLRNMNQQQGSKERKRKKTVVFFLYLFSILLSVFLLSSEPWMGLELPLSWHLSFSCRWSSWYPVTQNCRGKSTNKFGPITSQHGPQWRLFCSINCVWELLEGLRFIPQLSWRRSLHSFVGSVRSSRSDNVRMSVTVIVCLD